MAFGFGDEKSIRCIGALVNIDEDYYMPCFLLFAKAGSQVGLRRPEFGVRHKMMSVLYFHRL